MKKITTMILSFLLAMSLCACNISSSVVTTKKSENIPKDGIIKAKTMKELKEDNAIKVFKGKTGDIKYEWTVFGSKIEKVRDVNLSVKITEEAECIILKFSSKEEFDFSPLLSVHLTQKWEALNAGIFVGEKQISTAELTGTKTTIVNLTIAENMKECVIKPIVDSEGNTETDIDTDKSNGEMEEITNSNNTYSKPNSNTEKPSTEKPSTDREVSDGSATEQDKYLTDPVPEGKPLPVEPEDTTINKNTQYTCTFSIECSTIFNNLSDLDSAKLGELPADGIILKKQTVVFYEGESVFDVLQRVCKENGIQMESSFTPIYNSAYVEGINNLYEFDCGNLSGWMYRVDGWYPNYGCSRYQLTDGEVVEWRYTCDLGRDIGGGWME